MLEISSIAVFFENGKLPSGLLAQAQRRSRPSIQPEHARMVRTLTKVTPVCGEIEVQAEIKTGERRIINYLLSPIAKTVDEAGRER